MTHGGRPRGIGWKCLRPRLDADHYPLAAGLDTRLVMAYLGVAFLVGLVVTVQRIANLI
jgi:hypothetical protein